MNIEKLLPFHITGPWLEISRKKTQKNVVQTQLANALKVEANFIGLMFSKT